MTYLDDNDPEQLDPDQLLDEYRKLQATAEALLDEIDSPGNRAQLWISRKRLDAFRAALNADPVIVHKCGPDCSAEPSPAVEVTDEMIERAAIAAFDRDTMDGHHKGGPWTWEGIPEQGRCNYRLTVRAALLAALSPGERDTEGGER